mgnify:CR=1 FL=1
MTRTLLFEDILVDSIKATKLLATRLTSVANLIGHMDDAHARVLVYELAQAGIGTMAKLIDVAKGSEAPEVAKDQLVFFPREEAQP